MRVRDDRTRTPPPIHGLRHRKPSTDRVGTGRPEPVCGPQRLFEPHSIRTAPDFPTIACKQPDRQVGTVVDEPLLAGDREQGLRPGPQPRANDVARIAPTIQTVLPGSVDHSTARPGDDSVAQSDLPVPRRGLDIGPPSA